MGRRQLDCVFLHEKKTSARVYSVAVIDARGVNLLYPLPSAKAHSLRTAVGDFVGSKIIGLPRKSYPHVHALVNVDLQLRDGDRLGVIGHNGAGKTTLLRVLSGAYHPSSGSITVKGAVQALTDFTLGMDPYATGRQNIYFRLAFMGVSPSEGAALVDAIIDFSGLGSFIDAPVYSYSTGMYLRLAFSISTSFSPDILIMDEVIGSSDKNFAQKARARIEKLVEDTNILVLSSHSFQAIKEFCNKVIVMRTGAIVFSGPVEEGLELYMSSDSAPGSEP